MSGMGFGTVGMLDDTALIHHQDHVGGQDGAEPVGDDQAGAFLHNPLQGLLNEGLALAVEIAGGFVQYQDARIFENDPGNGNPLLFTPAQAVASLTHHRVVAIRQAGDEMVDIGRLAGRLNVGLGGVGLGIEQVGLQGVVEEIGFLGDHTDGLARDTWVTSRRS